VKINLGCGLVIKEGWHNVDKFPLPGVDETVDLFRYPFPFATNSADELFASHLIEHIPHEAHLSAWPSLARKEADPFLTDEWVNKILSLDGFFAFFAECWRVLKPGGTISVVAPHGQSRWALQDPSHCRSIVPNTFCYLTREGNRKETFDYGLPFMYETVAQSFVFGEYRVQGDLTLEKFNEAEKLWNSIVEIHATLRAVKDV
jgi:SAM-dependent methyltransferase